MLEYISSVWILYCGMKMILFFEEIELLDFRIEFFRGV